MRTIYAAMRIPGNVKQLFGKHAESLEIRYHRMMKHSYITTVSRARFYKYEHFAIKSIMDGKYYYKPYYPVEEQTLAEHLGIEKPLEVWSFAESYEAFKQFEREKLLPKHSYMKTCRRLIAQFNFEYAKDKWYDKADLIADFPKFVDVVFSFIKFPIPFIVKADLYRQIGMFSKCVDMLNIYIEDQYDAEIAGEILYRACNNDRYAFTLHEVEHLRKLSHNIFREGHVNWHFDMEY